jgi:hypothetical protein
VRRYIFLTVGVAVLCTILHFLIILFVSAPIAAEYWVRELIIVKQKLAMTKPAPRILFLGGSSTLFGIDAELVTEELKLPAFNMGLHAGLRLDRLLAAARTVIQPNDIVVMPLEYDYYSCNQETWDGWQLRNMVAWDRSYFAQLPIWDRFIAILYAGVPTLSLELLSAKIGALVEPNAYSPRFDALSPRAEIWTRYAAGRYRTQSFAYSAYNVDAWGNIPPILDAPYLGRAVPADVPSGICPYVKKELSEFTAQMRDINVRVLIANAPYLVDSIPPAQWRKVEENFSKDVQNIGLTLVDSREELFMPRDMFFNTKLHLNDAGRRLRTSRMITDLRKLGIGSGSSVVIGR